jgi:phospholipid-binding lipoprotein MlaA
MCARDRDEENAALRRRFASLALAACLVAQGPLAAADQSLPSNKVIPDKSDPWQKANRKVFIASAVLDHYLFHPLARLYKALTPGPIGRGLHNIVVNLSEPVVIANSLLQARPRAAIAATVRLGINTTAGLGGLIDVTARRDPHVANGFANTMGRWGVGPGPYLFAPMVGPTSLRDGFGALADLFSDPLHIIRYPHRTLIGLSRGAVGALDRRNAAEDQMSALLGQAADPYATLRSVYEQQRASEIDALRGRSAAEQPLPVLPDIEDEPPAAARPPTSTPPPTTAPSSTP